MCDLFLGIPCKPPPSIANGRYTALDEYFYQTAVTYSCNAVPKGADPFWLIGTATLVCTYDANFNGIWSVPPPECKGCWDFWYISLLSSMLSPELQYLSPFWKRWEGGRWTALEKKRSRSSDTRFDVVGTEARSTALWVLIDYDYIFIKTLNVHI